MEWLLLFLYETCFWFTFRSKNFSSVICWILQNNYCNANVLHLLDDFVTIDNSLFNANRTMQRLIFVFSSLNVPLASHKTVGSVTKIEYLGIILDTNNMLSRLPEDKLCRIKYFFYRKIVYFFSIEYGTFRQRTTSSCINHRWVSTRFRYVV